MTIINLGSLEQQASELYHQGSYSKAKNLYLDLLEHHPRNDSILNILGSISLNLGELDRALDYYKSALSINKKPGYYCNLALANIASSNIQIAIESYNSALSIDPTFYHARHQLASLYVQIGKYELAEIEYKNLLRDNPNSADTHISIGNLYKSQHKYQEAILDYLQANILDPDSASSFIGLAGVMKETGLREESINYIQQGLEVDPDNIDLYHHLGNAYQSNTQLDLAYQTFSEGLNRHPHDYRFVFKIVQVLAKQQLYQDAQTFLQPYIDNSHSSPWIDSAYAISYRQELSYPDIINHIRNTLNKVGIHSDLKIDLLFELGTLLDRVAQYDEAFHSFEQANSLCRTAYNPNIYTSKVDEKIENCNRVWHTSLPHSVHTSSLPVFIFGMPRSGTSLVEQILASHPDVYGAGELDNVKRITIDLHQQFGVPAHLHPNGITQDLVDSLSLRYLDELRDYSSTAIRITDKMPSNYSHLWLLACLFPNAYFIHCTRHPLDTCLSEYFQNFGSNHPYASNLEHLGQMYVDYQRLMNHWKSILNIRIFELSYETLVQDFEGISRQLLDYCNLEWNDACLSFHKSKRITHTASNEQVRQPIYTSSLYRHKNYEQYLEPLRQALTEGGVSLKI